MGQRASGREAAQPPGYPPRRAPLDARAGQHPFAESRRG